MVRTDSGNCHLHESASPVSVIVVSIRAAADFWCSELSSFPGPGEETDENLSGDQIGFRGNLPGGQKKSGAREWAPQSSDF
jgi:hypothetical protein